MKIQTTLRVALLAMGLPGLVPAVDLKTGIVVDFIARDKKTGAIIRDLKAEEIEISDAGKKQTLSGLRWVEGADAAVEPERKVRLVSILIDRFNDSGAIFLARRAADAFLADGLEPNTYYAVFVMQQSLQVIQPFTRDQAKIKAAVEAATGAGDRKMSPDPNEPVPADIKPAFDLVQKNLMRVQNQGSGNGVFDAMRAMASAQAAFPGRKSIMYISWGLWRDLSNDRQYETMVASLNRANVSVHSAIVSGVGANNNDNARSVATSAGARVGGGMTNNSRAEGMNNEAIMNSAVSNFAENLQTFSRETAGHHIPGANEFNAPMAKLKEEIRGYYEASYTNTATSDAVRTLKLSTRRPNVVLTSRANYLPVLPDADAVGVSSMAVWEVNLLKALNAPPFPRDIDYRAAAVPFHAEGDRVVHSVAFHVPAANLQMVEDSKAKSASVHAYFLGVIRNQAGEIMGKVSRDLPFGVTQDKAALLKEAPMLFSELVSLPAGRYTLETAIMDDANRKMAAKKAVLNVGATSGLRLSQPVLMLRVDQRAKMDERDPWQFAGGKVAPNLFNTIKAGPNAELPFYFVVYPTGAEKTALKVALVQDDKVLAQGEPELPAPDAKGRIPFIATLPAGTLTAGNYEVRVTVQQGANPGVQRRMMVTVE
jgi:VWFA-related protein